MNPIIIIGAAGLAVLALLSRKSTPAAAPGSGSAAPPNPSGGMPGVPPPPTATYNTGVDVGTIFSGISTILPTDEQRTQFQQIMTDLGTDPTGWIRTQPSLIARDDALAFADELDKIPNMNPAFPAAIRNATYAAMKLPAGTVSTAPTSSALSDVGLSTFELGTLSDWWQGFADSWSRMWWRR
jgi:hypothetical protein